MTSVRGSRSVYRERSEERVEEAPRRSYTTVKRYQVPESITRSVYREDDEEVKDKIVIKTKKREEPARHSDDVEYKVTERRWEEPSRSRRDRDEVDYSFMRTERSSDPPRRDVSYRVVERDSDYDRSASDYRNEYKVVKRDTEVIRAPSPPSPERVREFRFERERDWSPVRERPYDLERYSKSTEYFAQPAPQPIIIREPAPQAPIIIRERSEPQKIIIRREEPQYEFIERKEEIKEEVKEEKDESRSLVKSVKSEQPPVAGPEKEPEEDYFYERRVVERRRRSDSYDRKTEIKPRDSASNYSSDDSYEYVRKEKYYDDDKGTHHKRHLAEGAIAGIGAAEILRHHRKKEGKQVGGRARSAIGGAAVGALGAEALSRVRSFQHDRRSRSRSRSEARDGRRRRSRSRSREGVLGSLQNLSQGQKLGGLAAVAAVGALAGYALKNRNKNEVIIKEDGPGRRSRSRHRRGSVDSYYSDRGVSQHRDPDHRNRRIAQAGLASAAAAGIWEKVRSRSRGGKARSKSRIRQGVPIAAAGLGGAALAGLYEKNKANKEAQKEAIIEDELNRGRRRRSRSRSRSAPAPYPQDDRRSDGGPGLIAYGHDPIYPDDRRDYYSDDEPPGLYRRRGGSADSSPDARRRRSRSRNRRVAEMGAAAGVGGLAAHEFGRQRERSRVEADRRRNDHDAYYNQPYAQDPYSPPSMVDNGYAHNQQYPGYGQNQYPSSNYFPPPPTGDNAQYPEQQSYPTYNPADYANQPHGQQHPYDTAQGAYDPNLGQPGPNDTFAGDARYGQDHGRGRGRPDPENVSAPNYDTEKEHESQEADGVNTPRQRSTSRVRFDLDSNVAHSPEADRRKDDARRGDPSGQRSSDTETSDDRKHRRRSKRSKGKERARDDDDGEYQQRRSHSDRDRNRSGGDDGNDSDDTVDLPDRFDEHGNRKAEDPLAQKINELLAGHGRGGGGLLQGLMGGILGGGHGAREDDVENRSGTSRRRHRR